jgi:hypothetical protein
MGKGGSKTRLPAGLDALSLIQAQSARLSAGGRNELFKQVTQALKTGKAPSARIPIIQQAVSASRQAGSRAMTSTAADLAKRNIGGSFASQTMAQTRQAGEQATAAIAPNAAFNIATQAPNILNMIPGGSLAKGDAGSTTPNLGGPAIGAGGDIAGALITALGSKGYFGK